MKLAEAAAKFPIIEMLAVNPERDNFGSDLIYLYGIVSNDFRSELAPAGSQLC